MVHILIYSVILIGVGLLAYFERKRIMKKSAALIHTLTFEGSKLETDLLNKVHALENGGHLAAGTTAQLVQSQVASPVPNGSSCPACATPATTV